MKYDFKINTSIQNAHTIVLQHIRPETTVLEFGTATGYMTEYMYKELNCQVYGVEIEESAARVASAFTVDMEIGDVESLTWTTKFKNIKFDHIIFVDVLEHLKDPWRVLKIAVEFLKEEGTLITSIPNISNNAVIMELLSGRFEYKTLGLLDNTHLRFFTKSSILELYEQAGLQPIGWYATYMVPEQTEFKQSYENYPLVRDFLQQRTDGEIYQYITVGKKTENAVKPNQAVIEQRYRLSSYYLQLFWSENEEFTEYDSVHLPLHIDGSTITYDIPLPNKEINKLRFDPISELALIKLSEIYLLETVCDTENGIPSYIQKWSNENNFEGCHFYNLVDFGGREPLISLNKDPYIILNPTTKIKKDKTYFLRIKMSVSVKNSDLVEELNRQYSKIKREAERLGLLNMSLEEEQRKQNKLLFELEHIKELLQEKYTKDIETFKSKILQLEAQLEVKNVALEEHRKNISTQQVYYESEIQKREEATEKVLNELQVLLNSTSWKYTRFFRAAMNSLRELKNSAKHRVKNMIVKHKKKSNKKEMINLLDKERYILVFSHTNYLNSMGGTEKYIYEQASYNARSGIGTVQIFPSNRYDFYAEEESFYGINVGDTFLGYLTAQEIVEFIQDSAHKYKKTYIHHLLFWIYSDFKNIFEAVNYLGISSVFVAHDFFACCSSYHMMYSDSNGKKGCIPDLMTHGTENVCIKCDHYADLEKRKEIFNDIFNVCEKIVLPSQYVLEVFKLIYPKWEDKFLVHGHLRLVKDGTSEKEKVNEKIKIAYLGYKMENKGWSTWLKMINNEQFSDLYEFHHIGSSEHYSTNVRSHEYSFINDGRMAATNLLKKENIDIVLLWSIVPESYSYTLYESIAAGVPVVTNKHSGNIAFSVQNSSEDIGVVLNNEKELWALLSDNNSVLNLVNRARNLYELEYNELD
ncbi:methyltransferase domain-containing protein [Paenibacillus chitinolyticus]|uniref:Methyltransferase domain-containing protein n=1 Tax=Paenibacillus chitinolyticus TaxID=79263 RepID=A0A410WRX4_9BACL|nr:methyltransferase domain-containing protein [Paenibacillus chitinolyticus]MCY9592022.1 methyltransferase domain-containing protein [Paenibacillus chitinolyticus]MCY9598881.1 methyltransferase domain-containing protein [Paenibacillus chitinolyticus]QAV17082.1 methyltransferase domain-containing protein [Paenibacillus chitinolyticus]